MASQSRKDISDTLKNLKFRKKMFGGIDEKDVWQKLDNFWEEYQAAYDAEDADQEKKDCKVDEIIKSRRRKLFQKEEIIIFFERLIFLGALLYIIFGVFFGIKPMKNNDMAPKISAGDLMLFYRLETKYSSRDVVVIEKDGIQYTGRIVAKGGDRVEITEDEEIKINGSLLVENDIYYSTPQYENKVDYPITLDGNQFFILCDYRKGAKDSRYFGAVEFDEIKGKVITIIRKNEL